MILKGKNLYLRAIDEKDFPLLYSWRFSETAYNAFYEFPVINQSQYQAWLTGKLDKNDEVNFIVCLNDGIPIGMISLIGIDLRNRKAEMGRVFVESSQYQGKGYGKEMIEVILMYGFNHLGLNKIYCEVLQENEKALNSYKKCGFEIEGTLKEHIFKNGLFQTVLLLSCFNKQRK